MRRLDLDRFLVTTELVPPRGADAAACRAHAVELAAFADAINITDGAGAAVRMSAVAATAFVAETGAAPIVQLTVRDRNSIALAAETLGAAALGAAAILPLGGDPVAKGENPDAAEVRELDTPGLIRLVAGLCNGVLPSGRSLDGEPPHLVIGAAASPAFTTAAALAERIDAGAAFVQTQIALDVEAFERWMVGIRELGLHRRASFIPSVAVPGSRAACERLRGFGGQVADDVAERAEAGDGLAAVGEVIEALVAIEGVRGVHLIPLARPASEMAWLAAVSQRCAARMRQP